MVTHTLGSLFKIKCIHHINAKDLLCMRGGPLSAPHSLNEEKTLAADDPVPICVVLLQQIHNNPVTQPKTISQNLFHTNQNALEHNKNKYTPVPLTL